MPIGTSDGEYFDNAFEASVSSSIPKNIPRVYITGSPGQDDNVIDPSGWTQDYNVVTPGMMGIRKELDSIELDPELGIGREINFKRPLGSPTEPAGAFKSEGGTQVPGNVDWTKMNQPFGSIRSNSPEDTPVVAQAAGGRIRITEGDIERAINVGMGGGPGTMVGIKSKIFDKNALAQAQIMASHGAHPDEIFMQTGTFKGRDGRWRQELDDSGSKLADRWINSKDPGPYEAKLGAILDHPELYKAYPELKDVKVRFDPNHPSAHWDKTKNEIVVGKHFRADKGTFYHEIQHAVQDIEGFAKGTYPGKAVADFKLKLQDAIQEPARRLRELYDAGKTRNLDDHETAERNWLTHVITKFNEYVKAATDEAYTFYLRSAGETEARNVDTRVLMSARQRRQVPPSATEDLPPNLQIPVTAPNRSTAYGIENVYTGEISR